MAYGGEVATAYVRVRANLEGLEAQISQGVRAAMAGVQRDMAAMAAEGASGAAKQAASLDLVGAGYREVGAAAARSAAAVASSSTEARDSVLSVGTAATESARRVVAASAQEVAASDASASAARRVGEATAVGVGGVKGHFVAAGSAARGAERDIEHAGRGALAASGAFGGMGRALVFASGGFIAGAAVVRGVKDAISGAASLQKSTEVIRTGFGAASAGVLKFAEGAAKLGISARLADATSARFGILFKNLGIAQPVAAKMAVGFEQLVGSLSAIRGVDPSTIMQNISLAAAGNTRGLKQLGIVVDGASEKVAAFKLGLTQSISQALTPAQKSEAIYAIATAHLGDFQRQAAAHAGDLANVQHRLSAEWSNAKDTLGNALLPAVTSLVTFLAGALPGAVAAARSAVLGLKTAFHDVSVVIQPVVAFVQRFKAEIIPVAAAVGGAVTAILAITAAMKIWSVVTGIVTAAQSALDAALIANPIGAVVAATAALIAGMVVLYERSATVRRIVNEAWSSIRQYALVALSDIKGAINTFVTWAESFWSNWGSTIKAIVHDAWDTVKNVIKADLQVIQGIWDVFKGLFTGDWTKAWDGLKKIVGGALDGVKAVVEGWGKTVFDLFSGIWRNIELAALKGVARVLSLINAIPTKFNTHIPGVGKVGFGNPAGGALKSIQADIAGIEGAKAAKDTADAAARDTAAALRAKTTDPMLIDAAQRFGKAVRDNIKTGVTGSPTGAATTTTTGASGSLGDAAANAIFNQSIATAIANAKQRLANAIQTGNEQIAAAQQSLGNFILSGQQRISSLISASNQTVKRAAESATSNLSSIADKLISTIGRFYQAGGGTQGLEAGALTAQFQRLKGLIAGGGPQAAITQAAQTLSQEMGSKQAKALGAGTKALAQQHITTLVDEFNKGQLSAKGVNERLLSFLKSQGITYASVGKLWGKGLRDAMWAQITALMQQLQAIGAEPSSLRALSKAAAATGGIKIVDPNAVRAAQNLRISQTRENYDRGLRQRVAHEQTVERRSAERVAAARHAEIVTLHREGLRVAAHAVTEHKKAVTAARRTAKAASQTAATNAALAGTQVNGSAFRTSPAANPGKASRDARATATGGLPSG